MSEVLEPRAVVGTWRLVAYERHSADGAVSFPLGHDAVGYLSYTPDGFIFASLMSRARPAMSRPNWADLPDVEKAAFADSIIAYCGRYELRDDRIVHHVEQSLNPAVVDSAQDRFARLDGARLTVSDVPFDGTRARQQAVWERATRR